MNYRHDPDQYIMDDWFTTLQEAIDYSGWQLKTVLKLTLANGWYSYKYICCICGKKFPKDGDTCYYGKSDEPHDGLSKTKAFVICKLCVVANVTPDPGPKVETPILAFTDYTMCKGTTDE